MENSIGIIGSNLTITNTSLYLWSDEITDKYPGVNTGTYEYQYNHWRYMRIRGKL